MSRHFNRQNFSQRWPSQKWPGKACAMSEDAAEVGCYNPRRPRPQLAMRTVFEQADVGAKRSSRRSKMSSNCRAAFPGHLRTRNANACPRVPGWVRVVSCIETGQGIWRDEPTDGRVDHKRCFTIDGTFTTSGGMPSSGKSRASRLEILRITRTIRGSIGSSL